MQPFLRKLMLTSHVVASIGWLGAVACFLALAAVGILSVSESNARAAYIAMRLVGWLVIVPLSFASLLTGIVQSLGTTWGLYRHYWVLIKLLMTFLATVLLVLHMQPTDRLASAAETGGLDSPGLHAVRVQLIVDAGGGLLILLTATVLSVYKPRGLVVATRPEHEA